MDSLADAIWDRLQPRLESLTQRERMELLESCIFHERQRFIEAPEELAEGDRERVEAAVTAVLSGSREQQLAACESLVRAYAREIHNPFSVRSYETATRLLPGVLQRLTSSTRSLTGLFRPRRDQVRVQGPLDTLRALAQRGTLVFLPTHLSNLDSPLLGFALHEAGLPPVAYGAGLNLFTQPLMAFWMRRLGAYTVDRRKRHPLYKDTLKAYSVEILRQGRHSLFFPGGTRSRSGEIERQLKLGLLGTTVQAWREGVQAGHPRPDIFVVPCTLSMSIVLEAETLIADALKRSGRSRYIIKDDEFSRPKDLMSYLRRVMSLDSAIYVTFSEPMDLLGNPVDAEGISRGPQGEALRREDYLRDRGGSITRDDQRERIYTQQLASRVAQALSRDHVILSTQLAAFAAWEVLESRHGRDPYRMVRLEPEQCRLDSEELLATLRLCLDSVRRLEAAGAVRSALPGDAEAVLEDACLRFATFHHRRALARDGEQLQASMELLLYYRNRLTGYALLEPS